MGGMIAAEMASIAHTEVANLCLLAPADCGWTTIHRRHLLQAALRAARLLFHDAEPAPDS
jgi:pimeloyl-ACP methyl ester carboxylesterase